MNLNVARALLADAVAQVLDNKVFRILVLLCALLIVSTFLVGFREEGIVVFWGWRTFEYDLLFQILNQGQSLAQYGYTPAQAQQAIVQDLQALIVEELGGELGMMLTIAATAFFVPRMLDKGSADTLFSKPLSRLTLLLSRYFTGILFVFLLVSFVVVGIYFGMMLNSGYSDPGFLWAIMTMTYLYAIVYSVVILVGVFTRSTVASILLGLLFFLGNGSVQCAWVVKEHIVWSGETLVAEAIDGYEGAAETSDLETAEFTVADEGIGTAARVMLRTLDVLHYVLPKTHDADLITQKLRRALETEPESWRDEEVGLVVERLPEGFVTVPASDAAQAWQHVLEGAERATVVLAAAHEENALVTFARRPRRELEGVNDRTRTETRFGAERDLERELEEDPSIELIETDRRSSAFGGVSQLTYRRTDAGRWVQTNLLLAGDQVYTLQLDFDDGWKSDEEHAEIAAAWIDALEADANALDRGAWYAARFGWDATLKFNAFFSIATSAAFAAFVLLVSWLRLRRIDF